MRKAKWSIESKFRQTNKAQLQPVESHLILKNLTSQSERKIIRIASNSIRSAAKIKELAGVNTRLSTIPRTIILRNILSV